MGERVGAGDLERQLERVRVQAAGIEEGVFGPASLTWRIDREAAIFLGAGRALLMQLAHPWVAAAIVQHSQTLADPIGRFHRTFDVMFTLVFGSLDQSLAAARRLHRRHATVEGRLPEAAGAFAKDSPYWANEISALRWVHATLVETALVTREQVLEPLTPQEREQYFDESHRLGALFGIPPGCQPPDWNAFAAYNRAMWSGDVLSVTPAARDLARQLFAGAGSWLRAPGWYRDLTAHLLPEPLRAGFGLPYGDRERRNAQRALASIRRIYPTLPARLRQVGPYQEALARLSGREGPDLLTQALNRFWIGRPAMRKASHPGER